MKAILAVDSLAHRLTGIGRYTWELAQRLPRHPEVESQRFYRVGRWVADPAALLVQADGSAAKAAPRKGWRIKIPRSWRDAGMRVACRGAVFHGPNFFLAPCADIGVITVHDLSVFKYPETHPAERVRQFERDFSDSLKRSARIITDTQTVRDELVAWAGLAPERVTAVPLAVSGAMRPREPAEMAPALQPFGLQPGGYGLCVSTLEPRKQIGLLLQAWQGLPSALRQRFPLVLVGSTGWLNEALMAQIERGRAEGWLHYLGYVTEADLGMLYAGARAFFYPSAYEGFGLPPLEAMACGVPAVVSNKSCLPEVTQGAALLVEPADTQAFGAAVQTALEDEAWRDQAAVEGLKVAASYSWQRCVDQTVAVYQRALASA